MTEFKIQKAWVKKTQLVLSLSGMVNNEELDGSTRYFSIALSVARNTVEMYLTGGQLYPVDLSLFIGATIVGEASVDEAGSKFVDKAGKSQVREKASLNIDKFQIQLDMANIANAIAVCTALRGVQQPIEIATGKDTGEVKGDVKDDTKDVDNTTAKIKDAEMSKTP